MFCTNKLQCLSLSSTTPLEFQLAQWPWSLMFPQHPTQRSVKYFQAYFYPFSQGSGFACCPTSGNSYFICLVNFYSCSRGKFLCCGQKWKSFPTFSSHYFPIGPLPWRIPLPILQWWGIYSHTTHSCQVSLITEGLSRTDGWYRSESQSLIRDQNKINLSVTATVLVALCLMYLRF